jgi:uncharacterized protein (DUF362 family)
LSYSSGWEQRKCASAKDRGIVATRCFWPRRRDTGRLFPASTDVSPTSIDDVARIAPFAGNNEIYLSRTALAADLIVSVARMKTHHWAGATLSMKNLFGVVPGALYGWPKNHLHQVGIGRCVAGLNRIFPRRFAIVDGIVGMDGNGPIQGRARPCGVLVMGGDLAAVDATCCRIMGIDPAKIEYLQLASDHGHVREASIEQRGESIAQVQTPFELIPEFQHLRLG